MPAFPTRFFAVLALGLLGAPALSAQPTTATLTLTPGNNALTLSGSVRATVSGFPITVNSTPQATGSNVTQWTGTLTVLLDRPIDPTSITLLSAQLTAADSGNWAPLPGGDAGNAPANYGLRFSFIGNSLDLAVREELGSFSSGSPLPLTGSAGSYSFASTGTTFELTAGFADQRSNLAPPGRSAVAGSAANTATTASTLTIAGSSLTTALPLNASVPVTIDATTSATFRLVGTLRASGPLRVPPTLVDITTAAGSRTIRWRQVVPDAVYRAQYSDDLAATWQELAGTYTADGNGLITLADLGLPTPPHRFYRLLTP